MFQTKVVEEIKTYFMLNNFFFFSKIVVFMRQLWKSIVEPDRLQMTVRHMHIAYWVPKATNTH